MTADTLEGRHLPSSLPAPRDILSSMALEWIRHNLRLIRYYSAPRPLARWQRTVDIVVLASVLLGWPAAWILDIACVSTTAINSAKGSLFRAPDGQMKAFLSPDNPFKLAGSAAVYCGTFTIQTSATDHGWPFVTSRHRPQPRLTVELLGPRRSLRDAELQLDSPLRSAIESAITDARDTVTAAALWSPQTLPAVSQRRRAWLANVLILSILRPVAAWAIVFVGRLSGAVVHSRTRTRHRLQRCEGRCDACGYDLRAHTLSLRCPECGIQLE